MIDQPAAMQQLRFHRLSPVCESAEIRPRPAEGSRESEPAEHHQRIDKTLHRDRKSTRLNSITNAHLVCRLLLEKKKHQINSYTLQHSRHTQTNQYIDNTGMN